MDNYSEGTTLLLHVTRVTAFTADVCYVLPKNHVKRPNAAGCLYLLVRVADSKLLVAPRGLCAAGCVPLQLAQGTSPSFPLDDSMMSAMTVLAPAAKWADGLDSESCIPRALPALTELVNRAPGKNIVLHRSLSPVTQ